MSTATCAIASSTSRWPIGSGGRAQDILGRAHARDAGQATRSRPRAAASRPRWPGERQFFAPSSTIRRAGRVAIQTDYVPWADAPRRVSGIIVLVDRRDRAARRRARAARERGAVPADRQFGAGDDVGDPARPGARLRQRRLCAFVCGPGCDPERGADCRLAQRGSTPTTSTGSSPRASPARLRWQGASRSRAAISAMTASIAGCGACRSRASGPDGELAGFIGVASDITLAKEAELDLRRRSRRRPPSWAQRGAVPRHLRYRARGHRPARARRHGGRDEPTRAPWRAPIRGGDRPQFWDAPTLLAYPQHTR